MDSNPPNDSNHQGTQDPNKMYQADGQANSAIQNRIMDP